jgi:hypothetical protein
MVPEEALMKKSFSGQVGAHALTVAFISINIYRFPIVGIIL